MTWSLQQDDSSEPGLRLKEHLFKAYNGFADKRVKNLAKDLPFVVDDRGQPSDFGAQGDLYPWFCLMFARVRGPRSIELDMRGEIPGSHKINAWCESVKAQRQDVPPRLVLSVTLGQEDQLREFAKLVDQIVSDGNYSVPSFKYMCPRTAQSLRRLADVLKTAPRE